MFEIAIMIKQSAKLLSIFHYIKLIYKFKPYYGSTYSAKIQHLW